MPAQGGGGSGPDLQFQQFSYGDGSHAYGAGAGAGYAPSVASSTGHSVAAGGTAPPSAYYPPPSSYSPQPYGIGGGGGGTGGGYGASHEPGLNWRSLRLALGTGGMPDEPPLLQELGINFGHIKNKGLTVMNPFRPVDKHIMDDSDLAGPLFFCFCLGVFLLLSGKVHFGYIYGLATMGCASAYMILNLMSETGINGTRTASVLGYSLLPMVLTSLVTHLLPPFSYANLIAVVVSVLWCTNSASLMFVTVLAMSDQRWLVAYPLALLYSAFGLLLVFR
ncbi:hypothetical protein CXG81DRAFT_10911 [Caulochytrium protostelioides]|uniref:Protein YIP n=1 Tax=Caulochytrium protostelioides TaxID=1555241 RepID=A0A4P9XB48_9FUNG|nr:hypothetical protein CXG81DRAFT_10911 [Caulochytrium protostelioides]|eukprot:RKP02350.1 hypothetical protein CXG81DRAFT_10911 [Caulochytrium protostelioides]